MECKNFLCVAKEPKQFYSYNRSTCKECICARQRLNKKTRDNSLNVKVKSQPKTDLNLNAIILAQQKMLENQQKQTDAIISLTYKLLSSKDYTQVISTELQSLEERAVPATPRKYPQFSHYKNRL